MILGLELDAWVKIIFISLMVFVPLWVIIEIIRGHLIIEIIEVEEDDEDGGSKD